MALLTCNDVSFAYEGTPVLTDVTFSVNSGDYLCIIGENGSGKSTLLNMIGALDAPTSGKVKIGGKDIFSMNDRKLTFRRHDHHRRRTEAQ